MEQQEKYNFNVQSKDGEVVIRHGEALPLREKRPIKVQGTLSTVKEYLDKRDPISQINFHDSLLGVSIDEGWLQLTLDQSSYYIGHVVGKIEESKESKEWAINSDEEVPTDHLAVFMKKHIHHFYDKEQGRNLISNLMQFEAKVEKEIQDHNDQKGNIKFKYSQAIEHNLPGEFHLTIPLFKGQQKQKIAVEIIVDPKNYNCTLVSNELYEKSDGYIEEQLEKEIASISKEYSSLPIIYV